MTLDLDRIKQKQKETETRKGGGGYYKPQPGRNTVRVFTFDHKVTKEDVKAGLFDKDKLNKVVTELDRPVVRQFPKGGRPVMVSEKDVDAWRKKYDRASKEDKAALRQSGPQTHWMLNVVDTSATEMKVVEFAANKTIYNAILNEVLDPDHGEDVLGHEGRDFVIEYDPEKEGAAKYSIKLRDEKKCEKLPESLQDDVKDFYDADTYAALGGESVDKKVKDDDEDEEVEDDDEKETDESEEDDDDESNDEEDLDEEEDDLDDEDDDDDEDEVKPKGKVKAAAKPVAKKKK
jgi:hypothetical protein